MTEENKSTITLLAQEARQEHAELHKLVETVRAQVAECGKGEPCRVGSCLTEAMKRLREHVETHFDREEQGGWLEEAVVRSPHLAGRLRVLERQHRPLREHAGRLVGAAEAFDGTTEAREKLREDFETFSRELLIHESSEERILQRGFNEDLDLA